MSAILMKTHANKLPVTFKCGKGVWLWDKQGKKYLDALSGLGVSALGHAHSAVIKTVDDQIKKLIHTSNTYHIEEEEQLAEKLVELSGMEQVGFVNSGAEANEVAIKLTRLYAKKRKILDPVVITMAKAFHGHTLAATSASDIDDVKIDFEPFVDRFVRVPFNDLATLQEVVKVNRNTVAIMLETIQGDGGINIASAEYLQGIRKICDEYGLLMILDEVQCGMGRSGKWFAFQYEACRPDIVTLAKALANGVPIGVCLARGEAYGLFKPRQHGSTFGGNQLACAVALTVLHTIESNNLLTLVQERGHQLMAGLKEALASNNHVRDVRGRGLMIGIELDRPCENIMQAGLEYGILFNVVGGRVIRLLPPFIISKNETDELIERLACCISSFLKTYPDF